MLNQLPEDKEKIIKLLSKGNILQFQRLKSLDQDKIDALITGYLKRKPIIDEIKSRGVSIDDLDDLKNSSLEESSYIKAVQVLVNWLRKDIDLKIKAIIVSELLARKISKSYAFPLIIEEFKKADHSLSKSGFYNEYVIFLGNAIVQWIDDKDSDVLFELAKDNNLIKNSFVIEALGNFKSKENKNQASQLVMNELKKKPKKASLIQLIDTARRLKITAAKHILEPYSNSEDKEIKNEAKKALKALY